ncbi:MAG: hypothetical protein R3E35_09225 [Rhodocyclaceae bacterium]
MPPLEQDGRNCRTSKSTHGVAGWVRPESVIVVLFCLPFPSRSLPGTNIVFVGILVTLDAVIEVSDAFLDMLATDFSAVNVHGSRSRYSGLNHCGRGRSRT